MSNIAKSNIEDQLRFVILTLEEDSIILNVLKHRISQDINAYLGAGCINQRIWNRLTNRELTYGIVDYDLVYFSENVSLEAQSEVQKQYRDAFPNLNIECTNQARVHLWYEEYFGTKMEPLTSVEDGINFWPTTASAIGVYWENQELKVYAPRGFEDLLSMRLRANKGRITKDIYEKKVSKWTKKWPELKVVSWED